MALLPLEDPAARELLSPLPEAEQFASWHVARPGGRIASRGEAGIELLAALGHPSSSRAAKRVAGPIERLYQFVAGHRDRLGPFVPDGPAPRRFP